MQRTIFYAVVLGLVLDLPGCFDTKADPVPQVSTGTIQGKLLDSMTQQPIVGALISVGGTTATTDTNGKYTIANCEIPLDTNTQNKKIVAANYKFAIDLRSVTSPVNMATATLRYPDFSYDVVSLDFSKGNSSTTNPINYELTNVDFKVGKLSATLIGVVADKNTLLPVPAGYTVNLVSLGSTSISGNEYISGSTLTDANGAFTFANIEALRNFRIDAWNPGQTFRGSRSVTAPADGVTKTLSVQTNDAVLLASTDTLSPTIISVTPQMDADVAPAATDVVFTFSEPILQTADTNTSPSVATGLYNKVSVNYMGSKVSNSSTSSSIAHTLAWNSSFTQLIISIPSLAASSKYTIDLTPANALLLDINGNALNNTIDKRVLNFTTNGAALPVAPSVVTVVNNSSLNYNSTTVLLDWLPVSGAKGYNVYRAQNYPNAAGQLQHIGSFPSTLTSDFSDTLPAAAFVSGQNKLTYTYVVASVSADGIESTGSPSVTAQDNVAPTAVIPVGLSAIYTITFSEPVDEVSAVDTLNYSVTGGPTVSSVVLNPGLTTVTLTLSTSTVLSISISRVKDIAGIDMIPVSR